MIHVPTAPWAHSAFDLLAWVAAALAARWQHRRWPEQARLLDQATRPSYFISLAIGALIGAWLLGSLNSLRSVIAAPSHSVAGALAGGIVAVELWKWRHGVTRSTGGPFVIPLCVGIIVGRLGCLFAGVADFTYGVASGLPWAVELGDSVARHPVQLYESAAMAAFLLVFVRARLAGARWAAQHGFQAMILVYAAQRFLWEFLKPYPKLLGPLNLFHFLTAGLAIYGLYWWAGRQHERRSPA